MRKFSSDFDLNQLQDWHPNALYTLSQLSKYCYGHKIPLHLNSGVRAKYDGFSKSKTHQEGRAFDVRVRHWTKKQLTDVARFLSGLDNLEKIGAVSSTDNIRRLGYYHDNHLHIQVAR